MSGHHEEHHSMEQKPVSFTVPFYLAAAFILAVVMFLSLCDPKPHHASEGHGHEAVSTGAAHHEAESVKAEAPKSAETTVPDAEPAHH